MTKEQIIKHYREYFQLESENSLGHGDKIMVEWAEDLIKNYRSINDE